jgi:hypothetical protein
MKHRMAILIVLGCFVLGADAQPAGFTPLFNGKNLDGWQPLNGKAKFEARDGEIVGTTVFGEPNSFLATQKTYGDFILEFEFKLDSQMNSGVQFRSQSLPEYQNGRVHGYQFEIDPSSRAWTGGIYDEGRRDWLYPLDLNPAAKSAYKSGVWNQCRIECLGNTLRTFVNGQAAGYVVDDLTPNGFIALQVHSIAKPGEAGKTIRWRNIYINTNPKTASPHAGNFLVNLIPNSVSPHEMANGVRLLWDGKTTNGWRGANKTQFPANGWQIENGTLQVLPSAGAESQNGGDIVTEAEYGAFVFQFEFKLTDSANSGVKYFVTEKEQTSGSAIGLEYQILDDDKHPDAKLGVVQNRTLASLYDLIPSTREPRARRKIGVWNRGMIVVYPNNKIEHWLNGWKVLEYDRTALYFLALVARSKYAIWPNFGMAPKGHILLQDHGNRVDFRSLKIMPLQ